MRDCLLGVGSKPVPNEFTSGQLVRVTLSFIDSVSHLFPVYVELVVDRTMEAAQRKKPARASLRRPLFPEPTIAMEQEAGSRCLTWPEPAGIEPSVVLHK